MKILLSAYACEPHAGSEYGVGWNIAKHLAKYHEVYVLTRSRCRSIIETEIRINSIPNLQFIFFDTPKYIYYKNEIGSTWGEQYNYFVWQILVKKHIIHLHNKICFDLIHHITFNQYRTPSPGFFLNIPFIFGPIGGAELISDCFQQDLQKHTAFKERLRKSSFGLKLFGLWCSSNNKKHILCSSKINYSRLYPYKGRASISVLSSIGFDPQDFEDKVVKKTDSQKFVMIYAGKLYDWKGVRFFLNAVNKAFSTINHIDFTVRLIGLRFDAEQKIVNQWIEEFNLSPHVEIVPFLSRNDLLNTLKVCSLFVYPAFRDSGSMSILEASVIGCPTLCFDAGGQDVFPDDAIIKVPVQDTYEKTMNIFVEKLQWAYSNPWSLLQIGQKAQEFAYSNLTWNNKIKQLNEVYKNIIK